MIEAGISKTEAVQEMEKMLQSPHFKRSAILSRFFRFVVEKALDGHANQIKEYTIGKMVLDKPHSFNPQTDASVRIHALRLRKLIEEYYESAGNDFTIRIHLPKGSYCPVFSDNDLLISKGQKDSYPDKGYLAKAFPDDSICVLPFNHFASHVIPDFSPDGFSAFLSQKLSLFQDISVVSYPSVNEYLQGGGTISAVGDALDVTYYLSGDVEVKDGMIDVSVLLFDAKSNTLIWSQHFSGSGEEKAFSNIIEDITTQIAASMGGYSGVVHFKKVSARENYIPLSNSQAIAVFWFYNYLTKQNSTTFKDAVFHLEKAVKENQEASLCWAVLGMLYTDSVFFNYTTNLENPLESAQRCVNKALSINPQCQHGLITDGWIHVFLKDKKRAVESFEKTFSINPNASYFTAACSLGMALVGEYERSLFFYNKTISQHPMPLWWFNLPPIFIALKNNAHDKVKFYAQKIGTPAGIQEHIFELIGLYYLGETEKLQALLKIYISRHPNGLDHAILSWPMILFDDLLVQKIISGLKKIKELVDNPVAVKIP